MKKPCRIVIAEDHTILREGLQALLSADSQFDVVGEAEDGLSAVRCCENLVPDLTQKPRQGLLGDPQECQGLKIAYS